MRGPTLSFSFCSKSTFLPPEQRQRETKRRGEGKVPISDELLALTSVCRFISYILRFSHQILLVKKRFGFYFHQSERRNEFFTREKIVSSNHKPRSKRIVFSRAFSRSSRVALSGSFDKILYFRCTRVVRNSNFQVIKS